MGASAGPISCAWAAASAIRSLNQYAAPFITTASANAPKVPASPSHRRPISTSRTVNDTIRKAVFNWFISAHPSPAQPDLIACAGAFEEAAGATPYVFKD